MTQASFGNDYVELAKVKFSSYDCAMKTTTTIKTLLKSLLLFTFLAPFALAGALQKPVYLTFEKEDTSTSVTVNYMNLGKSAGGFVYYDTVSRESAEQYRFKKRARTQTINGVDKTYNHALLENLNPGQTYYFRVGDEQMGFSKEYKTKMIPNDGTPLRLVVGGDMSTDPSIVETAVSSTAKEPHVIIIGGDIAYANGKIDNEPKWMTWFERMEEIMITPSGYLVPLILAIGNHETTIGTVIPGNKVPFFFTLFPQNGEKAYFKRKLGADSGLVVLDSGHNTLHRKQVKFLEEALKSYQNLKYRMAAYHGPLYPNHRSENGLWARRGRRYWQPLFDKYKLTVGYEHHDHTLKRTHIIKDNKVTDNGTVYVGDGCWGKASREIKEKWYLKKSTPDTHVWQVHVGAEKLTFKATGKDDETYDHFTLENRSNKTIVKELEL